MQIVHDVAPGSSLAFASAFNGSASFATNIQSLAAAGAKVIVDDVIYLGEPMFQDGIIAQAVNNVVAGGAAYFSSAGNQARKSYQSVFRAGTVFAAGAIPSSAPGAPRSSAGPHTTSIPAAAPMSSRGSLCRLAQDSPCRFSGTLRHFP